MFPQGKGKMWGLGEKLGHPGGWERVLGVPKEKGTAPSPGE